MLSIVQAEASDAAFKLVERYCGHVVGRRGRRGRVSVELFLLLLAGLFSQLVLGEGLRARSSAQRTAKSRKPARTQSNLNAIPLDRLALIAQVATCQFLPHVFPQKNDLHGRVRQLRLAPTKAGSQQQRWSRTMISLKTTSRALSCAARLLAERPMLNTVQTRRQDFEGQKKAERYAQLILIGSAIVGFLLGFVAQDLRITFGLFGSGFVAALLVRTVARLYL